MDGGQTDGQDKNGANVADFVVYFCHAGFGEYVWNFGVGHCVMWRFV